MGTPSSTNGQQITKTAEGLRVPDRPIIPFIRGDLIGIDITPAMLEVVDAARLRPASIRDEPIDRTEARLGVPCSGVHSRPVGDVARNREGAAARTFDLRHQGIEQVTPEGAHHAREGATLKTVAYRLKPAGISCGKALKSIDWRPILEIMVWEKLYRHSTFIQDQKLS